MKIRKNFQLPSLINSQNISTINSTLEVGQIIRNGANYIFEIEKLTNEKVILKSINDIKERTLAFNRSVFVSLFKNKNFDQLRDPQNWLTEIANAKRIGASRFLLK